MLFEDDPNLIILGASARAAAQSAVASGYQPSSLDLFGDADLRQLGPVTQIVRYPAEFLPALARAPQAPWIYTGGLENYPRLVARLARLRPLLGNGPETLRKVRDPEWLARKLVNEVIRYPTTNSIADGQTIRDLANDAPTDWILKPRRSGGGLGIKRSSSVPASCPPTPGSWLQQRFVPGQSLSASFLAAQGEAQWIGAAEQWIGPEWGAPGEFQYCGSLAPALITPLEKTDLLKLAQRLTESAGLHGLFGLDLVRNEQGLWLIEVNPRYTASMELHERLTGRALIAEHCAAFNPTAPASNCPSSRGEGTWHAKLIVYATHSGIAGERFQHALANLGQQAVTAADIPIPNSTLHATSPICTLLTTGFERDTIPRKLLTAAAHVRESLTPQD